MGCPMGKHLTTHPGGFALYEDTCLYGVFGLLEKQMRAELTRYTISHAIDPVFGWKSTLAWKSFGFLPELYAGLGHELRVVVSHRSFMASVRARMNGRCPPGQTYSRQEAEWWAMSAYTQMLASVAPLPCPVLHLSYEDLLSNTESQLEQLAEFAGLEVTQEALENVRR